MKLIIKITSALLLTALLTLNTSIKAFADDDKEDFTREEIIEMFWGEHWNSSDEGIKNPEGSLEYHILETWLDEQYGHTSYESDKKYTVRDWSSRESIRKSWRKYHEEYTDNWHYNDDKDTGEFTIEEYDPDTEEIVGLLYSFELKDGHIYAIASSGNKYSVNDDKIIRYLQTQEYDTSETYVPTVGKYILDNYPDDIEKSPYIFIIDEINRGEISKIFGELFFSIDPGYRGTAGRVKTQYQNLVKKDDIFYNGFYVPENIYIIGTMNDIDRSVESMDFAFRRRFAFKEITAEDSQQMLDSDSAWGKDGNGKKRKPSPEVISEIKNRMDALNDAICPDKKDSNKKGIEGLSSAYHIGASYFLKLTNYKKDDGTFDYDKLWDYHLKGLLSEYLRGMSDAEDKLKSLEKLLVSKR